MGLLARFRPTRPARARQLAPAVHGTLRVHVSSPGGAVVDATFVRGAITGVGAFSFTDPFGPEQLSLTFPAITIFDQLGHGDLEWLVHSADVNVVYDGVVPVGYPYPGWRWEGYIVSFSRSNSGGLSVSCVGALRQLDNYLAKPEYPSQPLTYEYAIREAFRDKPDLRVSVPNMIFPPGWGTFYASPPEGTPNYLKPVGVKNGDRWTGLVTRNTGSFDPLLTSYITSLLSVMYTERGRWTLDLEPGRRTVLRHRDFRGELAADVIVVHPGAPGVGVNVSVDWSQSLNVAFGQSKALNGVAYSGQQVSADGARTFYLPLAAMRQVDPIGDRNGWLQSSRMRKEVNLQLQDGLDYVDARKVAVGHLTRFADPGCTGSIELDSDPRLGGLNGPVLPRLLIQAGMTVWVPLLFGNPDGMFFHITAVAGDVASGKMTLTVDSKYRDSLTVDEVKLRGRDALSITRALIAGQYKPLIDDSLIPWNYANGSGYIPSGKEYSSQRLFKDMPDDITFPWTSWTTRRPPQSSSWEKCYVRLGPADFDAADNNWTSNSDKGGIVGKAIPITVSQAAKIRLLQMAAYDKFGNVLPVGFHASFYYQRGTNVTSMPKITAGHLPAGSLYSVGQYYPFFDQAFQQYNFDGTEVNPKDVPQTTPSTGLIQGSAFGDFYERAGHWPGSYAAGDPATGLLVVEDTFSFDLAQAGDSQFDPYKKKQTAPYGGQIYMMIYCDQQLAQEVYFAGRMFRAEPGTNT